MRFSLFEDNWLIYNVTNLGKFNRGKSKHRPRDDKKLYGGKYPFIQTGDIKRANLYINAFEQTYSDFGLNQSKLWKKGTLCITIAANIAETAILDMDACFPDSVIGWESNDLTTNIFIKYYFDFYKEKIKKLSVGGAQENLNLDKLEKLNFKIPTVGEQNKISKFLALLDDRIETQIKIIEDYIALRKQIIENELTIQSAESTEYKLSNILIEAKNYSVKNGSIPHATLSKEGIYEKNERYDRDFLVKSDEKAYKISEYNDICYNPANLKFGVITINKFGDCIFSPIYVTFKVKEPFDPDYIALYLCRDSFIKKARKFEQGTVYERTSVSPEDLLSIKVLIPSLIKQKECVHKIELINLKIITEEKLLSNLKLQKSYLLNNLFI